MSKRKYLKQHGLGNKPNRAEPLSKEEIQLLYDKNLLGSANPRSLINTMFFNNTMYFGMRSRLEHVELRWGDIELQQDSTGQEFLIHNERATKTRTGQTSDARSFMPKMFACPGMSRCPVAAYKFYKSKRPEEMMSDDSPFYIGIAKETTQKKGQWFIKQAMGKNTISHIMKVMCDEAGIAGKKSNRSARKTLITNLVHAGVENTVITQLSGHKNVQSINNYSSASLNQQKQMSDILTELSNGKENTCPNKNDNASDLHINPYEIPNDNEDDNLVRASQELVEETLKTIEQYETHEILLAVRKKFWQSREITRFVQPFKILIFRT